MIKKFNLSIIISGNLTSKNKYVTLIHKLISNIFHKENIKNNFLYFEKYFDLIRNLGYLRFSVDGSNKTPYVRNL